MGRINFGLFTGFSRQSGNILADQSAKLFQAAVVVLAVADPAHHVGSVGCLRVGRGDSGHGFPAGEIDKVERHGGSPDVHGRPVELAGGVAGLAAGKRAALQNQGQRPGPVCCQAGELAQHGGVRCSACSGRKRLESGLLKGHIEIDERGLPGLEQRFSRYAGERGAGFFLIPQAQLGPAVIG